VLRWDFEAVLGGMRIGDSFFVPCLRCQTYRSQIKRLAREFGIEVRCMQRTENYIKGVRTWRIR